MIQVIEELLPLESEEAMCAELGNYLGLERPVAAKVLARAQLDDRFAMHLVMSRRMPRLLQLHLDDSRNADFEACIDLQAREFSNLELVGKAANAIAKWGRSGFKKIDPAIAEQRLEICHACPNLADAPDRLIYRVTLAKKSNPQVCNQCGCAVSNKVKVPTESCPIGKWGAAD